MQKKNILITGTSSGLGKFLKKKFNGVAFNRQEQISFYKNKKWKLIIHAGFYTGDNEKEIKQTIKLSKNISSLKAEKMIFISSLIVYDKKKSSYKQSKIICEKFFKNKKNSYILRLGALIGKEMRHNTISKILLDKNPKIGLSKNSRYSFISYDEIYVLIKQIILQEKIFITDFLRQDFITLNKIALELNKKVKFGNFTFNCIDLPNKNKIHFINIIKNKSSIDILKKFKAVNKKS